jgi:hypothetical protein
MIRPTCGRSSGSRSFRQVVLLPAAAVVRRWTAAARLPFQAGALGGRLPPGPEEDAELMIVIERGGEEAAGKG